LAGFGLGSPLVFGEEAGEDLVSDVVAIINQTGLFR
jgi:hypothetical protein